MRFLGVVCILTISLVAFPKRVYTIIELSYLSNWISSRLLMDVGGQSNADYK